jgi:diacylglycerol kinase family enzyme
VRALVVVNPRATAMSPRERDVLAHALGGETALDVVETTHRHHAAALAREAMRTGTGLVVALGGDGTVNEVINGLLSDGIHPGVPALGVVPAGSTNVFVRALGIPKDAIEATGALLEGLRSGASRSVSLGMADDRYFCFAAGLGFDAQIVHGVEAKRQQGRRSTHVLYTRVGVREFLKSDRRHPRVRVDLPDGTQLEHVYFAIVANADPWTFVGNRPLHPTPEASFETGLDLYARRRMGTAGMLLSMGRMSGNRPKVGSRGAFVVHDLDRLTLVADEPLPFQVDGDAVDFREKVAFRSIPDAIRVVGVPLEAR